jgi:hypothetical protein
MPFVDLHIDDLVLRVPGLTLAEGERLANLVQDRLTALAATGHFPSHVGQMEIRLELPVATPLDKLAERIVLGISAQLGLES